MTAGAAVIAVAIAACRGEGSATARATVHDSAGVQIVENTAAAWPAGAGWTLSPAPTVSIGVVEGNAHYQLDRVVGAMRMSDGRIVVADGGANDLRFYDTTGKYLSTSGRKGGGPGEFEGLIWIARIPGDSILTFDWNNRRLSVFDAAGHFVRSPVRSQQLAGLFPSIIGRFADGSLALRLGHAFGPGQEKGGTVSYPLPILHLDVSGTHVDTIGQFPGSYAYVELFDHGLTVRTLPFGRSPVMAVYGSTLYYGSSDHYEIGAYTPAGTLRRSIRRTFENLPVTRSDIDAYTTQQMQYYQNPSVSADARARAKRVFAEMPYPDHMPAYQHLIVDAQGNLWVEEYRRPTDTRPVWTVFDSTGQMLGAVTMPERFFPLEIGADYVLGRWQDELEVQYVREFGLEKPVAPGDDRSGIPVRTGDS
jgi:hypothetical protein